MVPIGIIFYFLLQLFFYSFYNTPGRGGRVPAVLTGFCFFGYARGPKVPSSSWGRLSLGAATPEPSFFFNFYYFFFKKKRTRLGYSHPEVGGRPVLAGALYPPVSPVNVLSVY